MLAAPADACAPLDAMTCGGAVVITLRGGCSFDTKARNAEGCGASAVVVLDLDPESVATPMGIAAEASPIGIPSVMVAGAEAGLLHDACSVASGQEDGQRLRFHLPAVDASTARSSAAVGAGLRPSWAWGLLIASFAGSFFALGGLDASPFDIALLGVVCSVMGWVRLQTTLRLLEISDLGVSAVGVVAA